MEFEKKPEEEPDVLREEEEPVHEDVDPAPELETELDPGNVLPPAPADALLAYVDDDFFSPPARKRRAEEDEAPEAPDGGGGGGDDKPKVKP
jgi:hypothetical protein